MFRSISFLLEKLITGMYQTWSNEIIANIYTHLRCWQLRPHVLGFSLTSSLLAVVTPAELDCTQEELWECDFIIC